MIVAPNDVIKFCMESSAKMRFKIPISCFQWTIRFDDVRLNKMRKEDSRMEQKKRREEKRREEKRGKEREGKE